MRTAVAVELRHIVAEQQRRGVRGLGRDRGRVVDRQDEGIRAQGVWVDAPAGGADRDARDHDRGALGRRAGAPGGVHRDGGSVIARPDLQGLQVGGAVIPDDGVANSHGVERQQVRARLTPAPVSAT